MNKLVGSYLGRPNSSDGRAPLRRDLFQSRLRCENYICEMEDTLSEAPVHAAAWAQKGLGLLCLPPAPERVRLVSGHLIAMGARWIPTIVVGRVLFLHVSSSFVRAWCLAQEDKTETTL